jgi:hypothetical protein
MESYDVCVLAVLTALILTQSQIDFAVDIDRIGRLAPNLLALITDGDVIAESKSVPEIDQDETRPNWPRQINCDLRLS